MLEHVIRLLKVLLRVLIEKEYHISHLESEVETLKQENANLRTAVRNLKQAREALGDLNRHYAYESSGKYPDEDEAMLYYLRSGGPEGFALRMRIEKARRRHRATQTVHCLELA